jgi:hypothetical protein
MIKHVLAVYFTIIFSPFFCQTVTRGPYLQMGTQNSMIVKWKTNTSCNTKVSYGTSISALTSQTTISSSSTDHEIKISGLSPYTKYYYVIGTTTTTFSPANSNQYFHTSPVIGTKGNYSFWVVGDAGTGDNNMKSAKSGFLSYIGNKHIDGWLWCGDNAYDGGFDSEYQSNVFSNNTYENELKKFVVWPAPGNHDYNNNIPFSPSPAYYNIFTLPTAAEAGGLASGTEKYYSYNYGNIHFIVLDSYDEGRDATDPMAVWLQNDLTANTQPWVIAYWHHPPYTKGSHNSDNSNFLDGELVDMRQNIIPILETGGVDLVLNGHSHCYERSYLVNGHYGSSSQLLPSMVLNNGSGSYPAACPYKKQTSVSKANKGTVYNVVGCSGKLGGTSSGWPHPVFYSYSNTTLGSMLLEIKDNRLDGKFVTSTGTVQDAFTIVKNVGKKTTHNVCSGSQLILKPSWPATVQWFPLGTTSDSLVLNPFLSTVYYAYDALSCITDTFIVNILPPLACATSVKEQFEKNEVHISPTALNSVTENLSLSYLPGTKLNNVSIYNSAGKKITFDMVEVSDTEKQISFKNRFISSGMYLIEIEANQKKQIKKIFITN